MGQQIWPDEEREEEEGEEEEGEEEDCKLVEAEAAEAEYSDEGEEEWAESEEEEEEGGEEEWDELTPLLEYVMNHRPRDSLGGRCPIHVMTGRAPDLAIDLALWMGVKLKDATLLEGGVERIDQYCDKLEAALQQMHEEIKDKEMKRLRAQALKEAELTTAHRFQVGDLVMVACRDTSLNPVEKRKPAVKWQGPCEVVAVPTVSELHVCVLGDPPHIKPKPVHWTRVRLFAGKDFTRTPAIIKSAQHDVDKFKIEELCGWRVGPEGQVQLLVSWYGFESYDNTWEDITQVIDDNPYRVRNFLRQNAAGHPPLMKVYKELYDDGG